MEELKTLHFNKFRSKEDMFGQTLRSSTKRVQIRNAIALLALFVLTMFSACENEINNPPADDIVFPDVNVSYTQHVQPLFSRRCAIGGCHAGSSPAAGLDLTHPSYNRLMNHVPRLVTARESNNSLLIQRLDGRIQPRMPLNSTPLTTNQLNGMKRWIDEGALNN
jgi:hypothetical protein